MRAPRAWEGSANWARTLVAFARTRKLVEPDSGRHGDRRPHPSPRRPARRISRGGAPEPRCASGARATLRPHMTLGVHFAITKDQVKALRDAEDDDALVELVEEIEEDDDVLHFDSDKAWDGLHRCLSDGTLDPDAGTRPLNLAFFGGEMLNEEDDYVVVLLGPKEVVDVGAALASVTPAWITERYRALDFPEYSEGKSDEDLDYLVSSFHGLPAFFAAAAKKKLSVIFTVSS